jgi:hypothetical protein
MEMGYSLSWPRLQESKIVNAAVLLLRPLNPSKWRDIDRRVRANVTSTLRARLYKRQANGPGISTVFSKDAADKNDERENDSLNGAWRHCKRLCMTVPPRQVRYVENRRPTGWAGVEYRKYCLQAAVQIARWDCLPIKNQHIVPGVPSVMNDPVGKDYGPTCLYNGPLLADAGSESPFFHGSFFTRMENVCVGAGRLHAEARSLRALK